MTEVFSKCGKYKSLVCKKDYDFLKHFKWNLANTGYFRTVKVINYKQKSILLHQLVFGKKSGYEIDHINQNKLDNRRCNLRFANKSNNSSNRRKQNGSYSSKYKGVVFNKKRSVYYANITFKNKQIFLGSFKTAEEAAISYNKKALELFGKFSCLNEVKDDPAKHNYKRKHLDN